MTEAVLGTGRAADRATVSAPRVQSGYIPGLDGIRAISIGMVMVAHYGFGHIVPGGLGVTLFFFLSGFLITGLLMKEVSDTNTISLGNFYARRFLRLAPEMLLLIALCSSIGLLFRPVYWYDIVASLTYTNNYWGMYNEAFHGGPMRWPHLWSLAVEEHFYLTFPIVVMLLGKRPRLLLGLLVALCAAALLWRLTIIAHGAPFGFLQTGTLHPYTYAATDARFDSIAYGCITAILFRISSYRPQGMMAWAFLLVGAAVMAISLGVRGEEFRETYRYTLQGLGTLIGFFGLFGTSTEKLIAVLELPVMRRMGVLSYGAYLWHLEPLRLFEGWIGQGIHMAPQTDRLLMNLIGFVVTFAVAQLSFNMTVKVRGLRSRFHARSSVAH